jgi:hypothetical protein
MIMKYLKGNGGPSWKKFEPFSQDSGPLERLFRS